MIRTIESLIERGKPFIIIKYMVCFLDVAHNRYELITLGGGTLNYTQLKRQDAVRAIAEFDLPLLHELDRRNKIWGDERFKESYKRMKTKYHYES